MTTSYVFFSFLEAEEITLTDLSNSFEELKHFIDKTKKDYVFIEAYKRIRYLEYELLTIRQFMAKNLKKI